MSDARNDARRHLSVALPTLFASGGEEARNLPMNGWALVNG